MVFICEYVDKYRLRIGAEVVADSVTVSPWQQEVLVVHCSSEETQEEEEEEEIEHILLLILRLYHSVSAYSLISSLMRWTLSETFKLNTFGSCIVPSDENTPDVSCNTLKTISLILGLTCLVYLETLGSRLEFQRQFWFETCLVFVEVEPTEAPSVLNAQCTTHRLQTSKRRQVKSFQVISGVVASEDLTWASFWVFLYATFSSVTGGADLGQFRRRSSSN